MNQTRHNLLGLTLLTIGTVIVTWTILINSHTAIAQTSLIPVPSLQDEQPIELLTADKTTLPTEVQSAVLNDVAKRTSKTVAALKIIEAQQQQWSDGCLGLGKTNELCTQALVSGWQVVVTDGLRDWTYRTDDTGNVVRLEQLDESS